MSLQAVRLAFGGPDLLDGVTLQIERGERVCLAGRNGVGKSTLIKIINREIFPDTGEVIIERGVRIATVEQEVPRDLTGTSPKSPRRRKNPYSSVNVRVS